MSVRWRSVFMWFGLISLIFFVLGYITGCASMPCSYQGKSVPRRDAERMKQMGMPVYCPDDEPAADFDSAAGR